MTLLLPPNDEPVQAQVAVRSFGRAPARAMLPPELPPSDQPEPLDWRRIWASLWRRRWLVVGIVGAGALLGVFATRFIPPTYRAQATVWIDSRDRQESGPAPFQPGRLLDPEAWLDLARSFAVLDEAARGARLYLHVPPDLPPALFAGLDLGDPYLPGHYVLEADRDGTTLRLITPEGIEVGRAAAGAPLGDRVGFRWTPPAGLLPPGERVEFEVTALRDASTQLAEAIQLHIDPDGNLLRFELEGTDPAKLTEILTRVTDRFVLVAGDLKRKKITELTGILADQLDSASLDLVRAESTYQAFRTRTITLPGERAAAANAALPAGGGASADPVTERYFALEAGRHSAERDREALRRALHAGPDGGVSVEALTAVDAARSSRELGPALDELSTKETELRALRLRYSEEHPEVIQLRQRVALLREQTIPRLTQALIQEADGRAGLARRDASAAAADLRRIPARSLEEARLRRAVALAEDLHNTLQQRHEEAQLAVASSITDTRILDHPGVPRAPVRDSAARILALAIFGSLGCAFVLVVLLDRVDPRFRYPGQITRELGLPIIGAIPHVATPGAQEGKRLEDGAVGPLVESLRGIRMALLNAVESESPFILAVSSPGSGDGKSFLTSHLAFAFAEAGYRTVLVDGDLRRGHLHRRFGRPRRPGLSDLLQGSATLEDVVRPTDYPGLSLITSGTQLRRAPELLAGPGLAPVMTSLRRRFQVIIIDTPPLSAGIDPYVLSVATGRLLLVMRTGVSHREMMTAKLAVLHRMPIDLMGVVMNDVPRDSSYGYYSYYLEGYETRDEEGAPAPAILS